MKNWGIPLPSSGITIKPKDRTMRVAFFIVLLMIGCTNAETKPEPVKKEERITTNPERKSQNF